MVSPQGGFYSALDADSEGIEGKFYTWTSTVLKEILRKDYNDFANHYSVTDSGNWEHRNILYTLQLHDNVEWRLPEWRKALYDYHAKRIWPLLDDKILLIWNAIMAKTFIRCFLVTDNLLAQDLAVRNMDFLWAHFRDETTGFYHTCKNGIRKIHAYADDLAYWMDALIEYEHMTGDTTHYHRAAFLMQYLVDHYCDTDTPLFSFTHHGHRQVEHNKQEIYDGATPSSNAIILNCLYKLWPIFRNDLWQHRAHAMVDFITPYAGKYPLAFSVWLHQITKLGMDEKEIIIIGDKAGETYSSLVQKAPIWNFHFVVSSARDETIPGLMGKNSHGIYICKNQTCYPTVHTLDEAIIYIQ